MKYIIAGFILLGWMPVMIFNNQNKNELVAAEAKTRTLAYEDEIVLDSTRIGISTVFSGLNVPWEIAWGPDNWLWITEQNGVISRANPVTGEKKTLLKINDVHIVRLGMMSMVLHPDMKKFPYVFLNYNYLKDSSMVSKLIRYTYNGSILTEPRIIFEIPANTGHNGSRLAIGADGKIMWATGDASCCGTGDITNKRISQDSLLYHGKVLRLNIDGSIPSDNPIKGNPVWSSGFRVPQGLVYATNGLLYTAEHGDATDDELNLIRKGGNYGYPVVTGSCNLPSEKEYCTSHAILEPIKAWTPTIAPAGIDYYHSNAIPEWQHSILMVTLKAQSFRALKLNKPGDQVLSEKIYFEKKYGRLRDLCVSPSGDVYISTSNRDWNKADGFPVQQDDRIIRLFKIGKQLNDSKITSKTVPGTVKVKTTLPAGKLIYTNYCGSCHKQNGEGVKGVFPPLRANPTVSGNKARLINIVLKGLSGPVKVKGVMYNQAMPAFDFLTDKEIADVLNYIRTDLGNKASKINAAEVVGERER